MTDYPNTPGYRAGSPETSRIAAETVADAAKSRSAVALRFILERRFHGATADEVADALGWERYSSRPRLAELHRTGSIVDSGERRKGASGRGMAVWIGKQFAPDPDGDGQLDLLEMVA